MLSWRQSHGPLPRRNVTPSDQGSVVGASQPLTHTSAGKSLRDFDRPIFPNCVVRFRVTIST